MEQTKQATLLGDDNLQNQEEEQEKPLSEKDKQEIVKNEVATIPAAERQEVAAIIKDEIFLSISAHKKKVSSFKRKYPENKIPGEDVNNKEALEKITDVLREMRNERTATTKEKKTVTEPMRLGIALLNSKFSPLVEDIEKLEEPWQLAKKKREEAIEEEKNREAKLAEETLNNRIKTIIDAGCPFDGEFYVVGSEEFNVDPISLGVADIKSLTDPLFDNVLAQVKEKVSIIAAAQKEKDERLAKEKEEQEKVDKAAKQKLIDDQKKIDDDKKALEEEKAENKRMLVESRTEIVESLGFEFDADSNSWLMKDVPPLSYDYIGDTPTLDWKAKIAGLKQTISEAKKQEETDKINKEKEEAKKQLVLSRLKQLGELGMQTVAPYSTVFYDDIIVDNETEICALDGEGWTALIQKITPLIADKKKATAEKAIKDKEISDKAIADKAIADKKEEDEKAEKTRKDNLAKEGDKAVWVDYIKRLQAIAVPEFTSQEFKDKGDAITQWLSKQG